MPYIYFINWDFKHTQWKCMRYLPTNDDAEVLSVLSHARYDTSHMQRANAHSTEQITQKPHTNAQI